MAIKPNIPSQYLPQPCGSSPRLTIFTHSTDFLFLIVSYHEPKRKPRFKTIRGLRYECGRSWEFQDALCIPQMNIPTNTYHVFPLPTAPIGTCIWYSITTACRADEATSFSPPIQYCYVACPPGGAFCQTQRLPVTLIGTTFGFGYEDVIAGNPVVKVNSLTMQALTVGTYTHTVTAVVRGDPLVPGVFIGHLELRGNSVGTFAQSAPIASDSGQEIAVAISGSVTAPGGELFTVWVVRDSGTQFLQIPASLNATSQWTISGV